MSFLENFAGSFLTGLGNEGMRRADEERQLKLQEALERRRIRMQYEAKYDLEPQAPTPFGAPVQRGPGNWVQQTKVPTRAQFDDENRIVQPSLMQEGPEYTVPDPYALDPKDAAMRDYRERQLAQQAELSRERSAALRARGGGSGGSGAAPKTRTIYDRETGEAVQQEWNDDQWIEVGRGQRWKGEDASGPTAGRKPTPSERLAAVKGMKEFSTELTKARGVENILALAEAYGAPVEGVATGTWTEPGRLYGENEREGPMYNGKPLDETAARKLVRERVEPLFKVDAPESKSAAKKGGEAIAAPPNAKPGDMVRQKSTGRMFKVQPDGTMVPV